MKNIEQTSFRVYSLYLNQYSEQGSRNGNDRFIYTENEFDAKILNITKDEIVEARKWLVEKGFIKVQGQRVQLLAVDGLYLCYTNIFYRVSAWSVTDYANRDCVNTTVEPM